MATPNLNTDPSSAHTESSRTNPNHANSAHNNALLAGSGVAIHPEHNPQRISHETRSLITFITLLLHALLLLLFAYLNPPERLPGIRSGARKEAELIVMPNRPQAKPKPAPQPKPAPALPTPAAKPEPVTFAARTARTSKFGMPLQDIDTQDAHFDTQAEKVQEATPEKAPLSAPMATQAESSQEIKQESEQGSETQPLAPEPLAKQITEQVKESVTLADVPKPVITPKTDSKAKPEISQDKNRAAKTSVAAPEHKHMEPIPALVPAIQATHTAPQTKKQLPSMAQLARGFLHALEEKPGDSSLTVHGDKNKKPTAEQLKIERYTEKLAWHIQNSFRIHQDKHPRLNIPYHERKSIISRIYLAVHKNGSIKDVHLVSSCGISSLDNFYLFAFKDAGSSFPPIPDYLHADNFDIVLGVTL